MTQVHPLAQVDPSAELAEGVVVGPFSYVEAGVRIGKGTRLDSHVTVKTGSIVGEDNFFGQGAIIGGDPQVRGFTNPDTQLIIGDRNVIREYVTIHRAAKDGAATVIGNDNVLMAYVHIAHDCRLGNFITIANNVGFAGHCTVEDYVNMGGMTGVHQWVHIGKVAMIGGMSRIVRDAPPFMITQGHDQVHDINAVGLRRYGITSEGRMALHKSCKILYKSDLALSNALETVRREVALTDDVQYLLSFEERRYSGKNGRGDQP